MRWFTRAYRYIAARRALVVLLQSLVSAALLAALVLVVQQQQLLASIRLIPPAALVLAAALQLVAHLLSVWRWQLLLRHLDIRERFANLVALYFIGLFCSLFLPTSAGGDALRAYDVGRRSGRMPQSVIATLQERLLGLCALMLIGLMATIYYLPITPPQLRPWLVVIQAAGALGIVFILRPALLFALGGRLGGALAKVPLFRRLVTTKLWARAPALLRPLRDLPALQTKALALLLAVTVTSGLVAIGVYYTIGASLQIAAGFTAFCLVVPLVLVVRMLPVSLGGLGVGEGAFVFLMGLFAAPSNKALALALVVLGLQTALALVGGLWLAVRMARGAWAGFARPAEP